MHISVGTRALHTAQVDLIRASSASAAPRVQLVLRWALLVAVIAAVFTVHVMTDENAAHGALGGIPATAASGHPVADGWSAASAAGTAGQVTAWVTAPLAHPGAGGPRGAEGLVGCLLFLVMAGSGVLLALTRRRRAALPAGGCRALPGRHGRPSGDALRLALAVIRV